MLKAFITGLSGPELSAHEKTFLAAERPAGVILFARNCQSATQIVRLIAEAKQAVGSDILVLIDQEGGRVQRLRPPLGRTLPPAAAYGRLYARHREHALTAAKNIARLMAHDLITFGINANCTPVLDLPQPGSHDIVGDRAISTGVDAIVRLGRQIAEGHMAGGVLPIMKHIPGHGRAKADSHHELPVVETNVSELSATDFATFKALADLPAAMTAHIVYSAIDASEPASTSPRVLHDIVRGAIGFDGLLMSDDLSMKALSGPYAQRTQKVLQAGCDLALHCNGDMAEMTAVAAASPVLASASLARFDKACAITRNAGEFDVGEAEKQLAELLADTASASESV